MAPVQWFGGKGNLKHKLLPLIPYANSYVEPFGGGGSILFARRPSPIEMYNDLDGRLVNLFRVLQNREQREALEDRLAWTLYARAELQLAQEEQHSDDPVAAAWGFFVRMNMGFGADPLGRSGWSYSKICTDRLSQGTTNINNKRPLIPEWARRLYTVQVECKPALQVIETMDHAGCVFFVDPPYVSDTRKSGGYVHEMDNTEHERLISQLLTVQGAVVLSGYEHPIYEPLTENGWELTRINWHTETQNADGEKKPRVECVWRNPRCLQMLNTQSLF